MESLLLLLLLLLMVASVSAWSSTYRYYGGAVSVCPKGRNTDGDFEVELRYKQTTLYCYVNPYVCKYGNCGRQAQTTSAKIAWESYGLTWCQKETIVKIILSINLPFGIRFPAQLSLSNGNGYWMSNVLGSTSKWNMLTHVDLGVRSDTRESNGLPVVTMLPIVRVTRNCPRRFNLNVFDRDGDRVRCRVPTVRSTDECSFCRLPNGFSLDEDSCSLSYSFGGAYSNHPIELVVEDYPKEQIRLNYSNGQNTVKLPLSVSRLKRQVIGPPTTTTTAPTTTTTAPTTTTTAPTTTTTAPTTTTTARTTTTTAPTTTTTAPTTTTTAPTTTTTAPTTTTTTPTTTTTAPTTTTTAPTTTTTAPTTTAPITTTTAPTTTTTAPTTTTTAPTTTTTAPTTTTTAPTTTTTAPTTTTTAPTTTTTAPTTTTTAPTTTTTAPTTTTTFSTTTTEPMSTLPLSKIPLQFTVRVDYHSAPSCLDGDYFPVFLSPTPAHGAKLPAFLGRTLEFEVHAKADQTTIYRLLLTGPSGISQRSPTRGSYVIRWTPTENELDCHFPICFISEAYDRYRRVYHSELRCVTVDVVHYSAVVTCNETAITVEVEKSDLIRRFEDKLHLRDDQETSCNLDTLSNDTHLVAIMPLNGCGTYIEDDGTNITFRNQITSADPDEIISRNNDVDIAICCIYPKKTNLTLGFRHKNPYAFKERGFGSFTFHFEFFESQRFRHQVDGSSYPVEVALKQMIYMQIQATSSIPNTELFVESCKATPYDNPESPISYTIIENGCVRDKTVQTFPSDKSVFRFGMEAFEFIGAHEEVYISCSVILCESGVPNTRCSQGCIHQESGRRKREASAQTNRHSISQGPLHLLKAADSNVSGPSLNLGLNLFFIVGSLLVCGAVVYRSRRSGAKYQRLATSETD